MKLAILAAAMLAPAASAPQAPAPAPSLDRMNAMPERPGCVSIPRQVSGEDRRYDGTRLDRQPPGRLILAVQREVGGCPEVTFVGQRRR